MEISPQKITQLSTMQFSIFEPGEYNDAVQVNWRHVPMFIIYHWDGIAQWPVIYYVQLQFKELSNCKLIVNLKQTTPYQMHIDSYVTNISQNKIDPESDNTMIMWVFCELNMTLI